MTHVVDVFFLSFFAAINGVYALLVILAGADIARRKARRLPELDAQVLAESTTPPIAILAPAWNEEAVIVDSVRSFLQIEYPNLEIVVVNDGSTDRTLERLKDAFDLRPLDLVIWNRIPTRPVRLVWQSARDPRLIVVDKENGGKADALNVGLNLCRAPLCACMDSDTLVDRQALLRMVEPFLYDPVQVVAVGGTVRVANGCEVRDGQVRTLGLPDTWLGRFQVVEYLRSFLFGRVGYNGLGGNLIISGAFGLFLREAVVEAGGYRDDTVGEDMELVVRLHRRMQERGEPYRLVHFPDPVCYTEVPDRVGTLGRQRDRWQRGLADSLLRHRRMFLNPRYGRVGLLVFPIFVCFELFGPVVELAGYGWFAHLVARGAVDRHIAILFFLVAFFMGFLLSVQSLVLDELNAAPLQGGRVIPTHRARHRAALILAAFVEAFGYRQLTLWFRVRGLWRFVRGVKTWGRMQRAGFKREAA